MSFTIPEDPTAIVADVLHRYRALCTEPACVVLSQRSDGQQFFPRINQINMSEPRATIIKHPNAYWTREVRLEWPLCPFSARPSSPEAAPYHRLSYLSIAKQVLDEMFATGLAFQIKLHLVWCVDIPSRDEYDVQYPMAFVPMSVSPLTLSFNSSYSMAGLIKEVRTQVRDKVEIAENLPSGVVFKSIQLIRLLSLPEPALLSMAPAGAAIPLGRSYVKLPRDLENKRACINIKNTDQRCFQYCLVCWKLELHKLPNPDRWPGRFAVETANAKPGRPPKNASLTFIEAGMDFSMIPHDRAPNHEEISAFELANLIGVYIYDWHHVQVGACSTDWARPLRSPATAYQNEVVLLLYCGHFCLISNFQAFVGRQHADIRTITVSSMHCCHRCLQNFESDANLKNHLAAKACNKSLVKESTPKLCLPSLCGKSQDQIPTTHFSGEHKKVLHPLVVFADFETFFGQESRQCTSKLTVVGNNNRVASFAYHAVGSQGYEVPQEHVLKLARCEFAAENFIFSLLRLASHYLTTIKNPEPMKITPEEEQAFQESSCCSVCHRAFSDKRHKVRDHNHFTGAYRGPTCDPCNKSMKNPKRIPIYFHNLKGFDGHLIIKAIQRLMSDQSMWPQELVDIANSFEEDVDDTNVSENGPRQSANRGLLAWMRTAGQSLYLSVDGRRAETWGIAMRSIRTLDARLCATSDFKSIHGVGPVIANILQCAPWTEISQQAQASEAKTVETDICERLGNMRFEVIAKNRETYPMIRLGPLQFMDTANFLKTSLDGLIKSQRNTTPNLAAAFPHMYKHHPQATNLTMEMLLRKIPMPFSIMTGPECFSLSALLPQDAYYNDLASEPCSDATYALVKDVVERLALDTFADYHDVYLCTDVLALADCFEAFRATFYREHDLDVAHFISMPSASMSAMLLRTGARIDLVCEANGGWDFMKDINDNVRGGLSCVFQPHARANNPELHDAYDPDEPKSWISYVDVNSLYPTVMCMPLPHSNYTAVPLPQDHEQRLQHVLALLSDYTDSSPQGYMFVVSFEIPEALHDHLDFAPVAKRSTNMDELSDLQRQRQAIFGSNSGDKKLMPYLGTQTSVGMHAGLLKFYVEVLGVVIVEVHRAWQWDQSPWMSGFIKTVSDKRSQTPDKTTKEILKLTMNSLYGMMLQNKAHYSNLSIYAKHDSFVKAAIHPRAVDWDIMDISADGFLGTVNTAKSKGTLLDTPRLVGFSILELSKLHMYRAHYFYFKPTYGPKLKLLMMDTDSFIYHIETEDVIEDMRHANRQDEKPVKFDLSTRTSADVCPNRGHLGCFKYEAGDGVIQEFMGLQSKMYCLKYGDSSEEKKAKGIPKKCLQSLSHKLYQEQLTNPALHSVQFRRIQCRKQKLEHVQQLKKGLSSFNDKVYQLNSCDSVPLGHYAAKQMA